MLVQDSFVTAVGIWGQDLARRAPPRLPSRSASRSRSKGMGRIQPLAEFSGFSGGAMRIARQVAVDRQADRKGVEYFVLLM